MILELHSIRGGRIVLNKRSIIKIALLVISQLQNNKLISKFWRVKSKNLPEETNLTKVSLCNMCSALNSKYFSVFFAYCLWLNRCTYA